MQPSDDDTDFKRGYREGKIDTEIYYLKRALFVIGSAAFAAFAYLSKYFVENSPPG